MTLAPVSTGGFSLVVRSSPDDNAGAVFAGVLTFANATSVPSCDARGEGA
jgi:hypothetical protein